MNDKIKRYRLAFASALIFTLVQSLVFTLYPVISDAIQISLSELIAVFGVGSSFFFFSAPFWTSVADSIGRMKALSICLFGLIVSTLLLAFCVNETNQNYLWLSRIVYGLFAGGIIPITQAIFSEDRSGKLLAKFTLHAQAATIGRVIGPLVGLVAARTNLGVSLYFISITVALVFIFTLFVRDKSKKEKSQVFATIFQIPQLKSIWQQSLLVILFAIIVMAIQSTLTASFKSLLPSFNKYTLTSALIFIAGNIVMVINQSFINKMELRQLFIKGASLFLVSSATFMVSTTWYCTALAYVLFCWGLSSLKVASVSYFCELNPSRKSSVIAATSLTQTVGYALSSILVSLLLTNSLSAVYAATLMTSIILLVTVVAMTRGVNLDRITDG